MSSLVLTEPIPEALIRDFACDPHAPLEKVFEKAIDPSWPLYPDLWRFLDSLPVEAVEATLEDPTFIGMYGDSERLARLWTADRLLTDEVARRRLEQLALNSDPRAAMPYDAAALRGVAVDDEYMVPLAAFDPSSLERNGFRFTVCTTTAAPNSTFWLTRSFFQQELVPYMSVRLDPFLWGSCDIFRALMYKMIVYPKPLDWDGIGRLRERHCLEAHDPRDWEQVTELYWEPRDDGIHFVCEELPKRSRVAFAAARYLHAIYDPGSEKITHFDGALRIYNDEEIAGRQADHLWTAGKTGIRRKIFRIDEPIGRESFTLVAQAFFVWNDDLKGYFGDTLFPKA